MDRPTSIRPFPRRVSVVGACRIGSGAVRLGVGEVVAGRVERLCCRKEWTEFVTCLRSHTSQSHAQSDIQAQWFIYNP